MIPVLLTSAEVELLMKPVRGKGGFQSLLKALQRELRGKVLTLTPALAARVTRYRAKYGSGGFQGRLAFLRRARLDSAA